MSNYYKNEIYSTECLLQAMEDIQMLDKQMSKYREAIELNKSIMRTFYNEIELIKKEFNQKTGISFEDAFEMLTTSSEQIRKENDETLKAFSSKDNYKEVSLKDVVLQQ